MKKKSKGKSKKAVGAGNESMSCTRESTHRINKLGKRAAKTIAVKG